MNVDDVTSWAQANKAISISILLLLGGGFYLLMHEPIMILAKKARTV